jgi:soluble lytic murein transglycosylase-like protein
MDLSIIPGAIFLVILVLSSSPAQNKNPHEITNPSIKQRQVVHNVETVHEDEANLDYQTILSYIKQKYKSISDEDANTISKHLVAYGQKNKLDPKFAAALMARESAFNKKAVSSTGAKGLGQIKNFNYKSLKIKDPFDIKENVSGTVSYLKRMLSKWKGNSTKTELALASYYKGYTAVKKDDCKMDGKTKGYVNDILNNYQFLKNLRKKVEQRKPFRGR